MKDLHFNITIRKDCLVDKTMLELYREENDDLDIEELNVDHFIDWLENHCYENEYTINTDIEWDISENDFKEAIGLKLH